LRYASVPGFFCASRLTTSRQLAHLPLWESGGERQGRPRLRAADAGRREEAGAWLPLCKGTTRYLLLLSKRKTHHSTLLPPERLRVPPAPEQRLSPPHVVPRSAPRPCGRIRASARHQDWESGSAVHFPRGDLTAAYTPYVRIKSMVGNRTIRRTAHPGHGGAFTRPPATRLGRVVQTCIFSGAPPRSRTTRTARTRQVRKMRRCAAIANRTRGHQKRAVLAWHRPLRLGPQSRP